MYTAQDLIFFGALYTLSFSRKLENLIAYEKRETSKLSIFALVLYLECTKKS